ncbi:hypothetical protein MRX96_054407 [Rhipicephalus microplus]
MSDAGEPKHFLLSASPVSQGKNTEPGSERTPTRRGGKANGANTDDDSGTNCSREGASARVYTLLLLLGTPLCAGRAKLRFPEESGPASALFPFAIGSFCAPANTI